MNTVHCPATISTAMAIHVIPNLPHLRLNSFSRSPPFSLSSGDAKFFSGSRAIPLPSLLRRRAPSSAARASSAPASDHYATLRVSKTATLQQIKTSYRNLARKYHPDMNKSAGAEEKFKEISGAYEVLSDDEKRSLYDRFGEAGLQGEYGETDAGSMGMDPFEVFETFFGGSDGFFGGGGETGGFSFNVRNGRNQSLDIRYDLHLSFEEAIFGGEKEIEISCSEKCENCHGTGARSSNCLQPCNNCGGTGAVMKTQNTPFGVMSQVSTCGKCGGDGRRITDYCGVCGGKGKVETKRTINVVIPPGVGDGSTMQIRGDGNFDNQRGRAGDLYIVLHVNKKHGIQRDGLNLYSTINLYYTEAILGTTIKVETVEGTRDLRIPGGIQPGETVKLLRMGVPDINKPSVRGDHHFIVNVVIPKETSDSERALLEKLSSIKKATKESGAKEQVRGGKTKFDSNDGITRNSSLWNSVKDLLGSGKSSERFAAISIDTSALLRGSSFSGSSSMVSIFTALLVTCICTLVVTTFSTKLRKRDSSQLHRKLEEPK